MKSEFLEFADKNDFDPDILEEFEVITLPVDNGNEGMASQD